MIGVFERHGANHALPGQASCAQPATMKKIPLLLICALWVCAPARSQQADEGLRLAQAQRMALDGNHDLRLALASVQAAQAAIQAADTAPNPVLTLQTMNVNPSQGLGAGPLRGKTVDSSVRIDQQIERGGKRALRIDNAQSLEQASRADLADVRRQLRLAVAQAYYDLLAAQDKGDIVRDTAGLYASTLDAARRRKKAGDLAGADVARIEVDALRAANDVDQADAELLRSQQTLALALGTPKDARRLRAIDPWPALPASDQDDEAGAFGLDRRADIRAAEARVRAAAAALRLALALRTRDITVGLQAEHWPQSTTNTQGSGNSFGIVVQIPLFVRNQYQGEIRNAQVAADSAAVTLDKVRAAAMSELARSAGDARIAATRLRRYERELLPASARSADAAEYAFRNGAAGVMDVLDARRTRRATLLETAAARADHARALAARAAARMENDNDNDNDSEMP
jgi:cobalt-zinc-cadmium efflux system outer membrane protein